MRNCRRLMKDERGKGDCDGVKSWRTKTGLEEVGSGWRVRSSKCSGSRHQPTEFQTRNYGQGKEMVIAYSMVSQSQHCEYVVGTVPCRVFSSIPELLSTGRPGNNQKVARHYQISSGGGRGQITLG